jgi:hypothetical protein
MKNELTQDTSSARGILKYVIRNRDSRQLLASHMKQAVAIAFADIPAKCDKLRDEIVYLNEALGLIGKERHETLLIRKKRIQKSIYEFFEIMEDIRSYSTEPESFFKERKLRNALRGFVNKLNNQTNLRINHNEPYELRQLERSTEESVFFINLRKINPAFHVIFEGRYFKDHERMKDSTVQHLREALLAQFSPELLFAYREAESLLEEAEGLATTPEDEHFTEQVTEDYYPHVFKALQNVAHDKAEFSQKEIVVTESIKQFKIIQLGLHKIIEGTIARSMNTMKSQTDFLRNKVLGSEALSLNSNELELVVDNSVEQAQKLREELYMKHVAPQIEQTRANYEAQLAHLKTEHEMEMKDLAVQNWQFKGEIAALEAQVAYLNGLHSNYPAPTFRTTKE